jgi:hypothetical protein
MEERRPNFWSEVWTQLKAAKEDFWKPYNWAKQYVGPGPGAIAAGAFFAGARALQSLFEGAQAEVSTRQEETVARKGYIAPLPEQEAKRLQDQGYRVWQGQDGLWFREKDGKVEVFANKEITARGYLGYLVSLGQTRQAPARGANKAGVSAQDLGTPLQGEWLPFEAYVGRLRSIRDQVRAAKTPEAEYLSDIVFERTMWELAPDNWAKAKAAGEYLGFLVANDPLNLLTFGLAGGAKLTGQLALKLGAIAAARGGGGLAFAADAARVLSLTFRGLDLSNKLAQDFVAIPLTLPSWVLMKAARWAFVPVLRPAMEKGKVVWKLAWAKVTDLSERAKLLQTLRDFTNMVREFRELDIDPMILLDQNGIPQGEAGYLRFGLFSSGKKQYFTDQDVQIIQTLLQETVTRIFKTPEPYEVRVTPMGKVQVRKQGQVFDAYSFLVVDIPTKEDHRVLIETAVKLLTSPPQPGTQTPGAPPGSQPPTPPTPPSQPPGAQPPVPSPQPQPSPHPTAQSPSVSPTQVAPPTAQAQPYVPLRPRRRRKQPKKTMPPDVYSLSTPPPEGDIPAWHIPGSQDPAQIDQFVSEQEVLDKLLFQDPAAGSDPLIPPDDIRWLAPEPEQAAPEILEQSVPKPEQFIPEPPEQTAPRPEQFAPDLSGLVPPDVRSGIDTTLPDNIVQASPGVSPEEVRKLLFQGKTVFFPGPWPPKWETLPDWGPSPAPGAPSGPAPSPFEMEGGAFRAKTEPPRISPWAQATGRKPDVFPGSWPPAWETPDQAPPYSPPGAIPGPAPSPFQTEGSAFRAKAEPPESPWARLMRQEPQPPVGEEPSAPVEPGPTAPEPPEPSFQKIGELRGEVKIGREPFWLFLMGKYPDGVLLYQIESRHADIYTYLVPEQLAQDFERRFREGKLLYPRVGFAEAERFLETLEDRFGPVFSESFRYRGKTYLVETEPTETEQVVVRIIDTTDPRKVSTGRLWNEEARFLHALLFAADYFRWKLFERDISSFLRFYGIELPTRRVREWLPLFEKAKGAVRKEAQPQDLTQPQAQPQGQGPLPPAEPPKKRVRRVEKEKAQTRSLDPTKSAFFQAQSQAPSPPASPAPDQVVQAQPAPRVRFQPFVPEGPEPQTFEEFLERARQEIDPHMDLGLAEQILVDPLLSVPDGDLIQLEAVAQANKRAFFSRIRPGVGRFVRREGEVQFQRLTDEDYRILGNLLVRAAFEWRKGNTGPAFDLLRFFGYAPIPTETGLAIPIENAYAAIVLSRNNTDLLGIFRTLLNLVVDFVGKPGITPGEAMRLSSARRREMQRLFEGKGVPRELVRIVHALVERIRNLEAQLKQAVREGKDEEAVRAFQELAQTFQRQELEELAKVPRIVSLSKEDVDLYRTIRALGEGILEGFQDEVLTGGFQGQTDLLGYALVRPEAVEARAVAGADALLFYHWLRFLQAQTDAAPASQLWRVQALIRQAVSGIGESIARFLSAQGRAVAEGTSWISKDGKIVVRIRVRGRAGEPKGLSDIVASLQWLFGTGKLFDYRPEASIDRSVLTKFRTKPQGEDSFKPIDPEEYLKNPLQSLAEEIEMTFEIDSERTLTGLLLLFSQATTPEAQQGLLSVLRQTAARLARDRYLAERSAVQNPVFTEDAFGFTVRSLGLEPENAVGFTEEEVGRNLVRPEEARTEVTDESGEVIKEPGMDPEKERIQGLSILYTGAKDPQRLLEQAPMLPLVESSFLRGQVRKTDLPETLPNGLTLQEFLEIAAQAYLGDPGPLRILAESLGVGSESLDGLVVQASGLEGDQARELLRRVADKVFEAERDRYDPFKALRTELGHEPIPVEDSGRLRDFPATLHYGFVSPSRATIPLARTFDNMVLWAGKAVQRIFGLPEAVQNRFPYAKALKQAMEGNFDWLARVVQDQGFVLHIDQEGKVVLLGDLQGLEVLPEARDLLLRALLLPDSVFTEVEKLLRGLRDGLEEWTDYFESADDEVIAAKVEDLADRVMEAVLFRDTGPVEEFLVRIAEEAPDRAEAIRRGFQSLFTELSFERSLFEALTPGEDDLVLPTTKGLKEAIERRVEIAANILANRGDLEGARALRQSANLLFRILQDYAETFWERYYLDALKRLTGEGFEYRLTQIRRRFNDFQGEVAQIVLPERSPRIPRPNLTRWKGFSRETLDRLLETPVRIDRETKTLVLEGLPDPDKELSRAYEEARDLLSRIQGFLREVREELVQPFAPFVRFLGFEPDLPDPFDLLFGSIPANQVTLGTLLLSSFDFPRIHKSGAGPDVQFVEALRKGVDRAFQRLLPFAQNQAWDLFVRFLRDDSASLQQYLRDLFFRGVLSRDWTQGLGGIELGKLPTAPRDRVKFAWQFLFGTSIRDDQAEFLLHSHGSVAALAPQAPEQPRKSLREILARRASQKGTLVLRPEEAQTFREAVKDLPQPIRDLVLALYRFQNVQAKIEKRIQDVFSGRNMLFSGEEAEGAVSAVQEQVEVAPNWVPSRIIRELESLLSKARGRKSLHALGSGLASFARTGNPEGLEIALRRFTGKEVRLARATESAFLVEVEGKPLLVDGSVVLLEVLRPGEGYQRLIADFGKILRGLGAHLAPDQFLYLEGKVAWPDRPVAGLVYPVLAPPEPLDLDWEERPFGRLSPEEREAWNEEILDLLFDPVKVPGSSERVKRIAEVGVQRLEDGTEVEVMSPLAVLEYLYFNSPSFRNLVRERPEQVEAALVKLETHRQGWLEAWNTFRAQYFVLDKIYSLLGPEVAAQYETDLFMRDLSRVLNDAFRVLGFERTTEYWDKNLGYRVALESGDIPEEFMLSPMNYQPMLEFKDIQDLLKKGSSIDYDLPPALDPVYAKLTRIFFDYAAELRQARESLVEVVERIYREGLGELALALSEAGVVLRGDEASRQAVEEAARRIYRTIAEACRLKGEPLA